ncbi:MAG: acyl-CoA thioester hydrolase/BAAT C-terminal domain-containing protein, partial [Planctomycetota bacterium]
DLQGSFVLRAKGQRRLPVIILLGGSEGGDWGARASAPGLASRGFAAVGVPYFSPSYGTEQAKFDRLPAAFIEIPIDRLEKVLEAIKAREDLDATRIGVMGVSKGAEFALLAAERFDWISAVCAIVPSDVVWEGWGDHASVPRSCFSWRGKPLPFVPYDGMQAAIAKMQAGEPATLREPHEAGRLKHADRVEAARIRVEDIASAVMLVGGDQDPTWNSGEMARNIIDARLAVGKTTEAWISPLAGHYLSGHAHRPMESAEGSLRSRTYPAMLDFFGRNLTPASHD